MMRRTDIRLLEKPFASHGTEKSFSAKASVLRYGKQHFFELWLACQRRENLRRDLGKIKSLEKAS
jgi:hypothetical protein